MRRFCLSLIALMVATIAMPVHRAAAHPHEFVTMRIVAQFDQAGRAVGLLYNWTFDPFFTAYAVEGQDANKNGQAEQAELDALLREILGNIASIDYFTKFAEAGVKPKFKPALPLAAEMDDQNQLVITFDVPFAEPVDLTKEPLRYAIYDEEFYIAMTHDPDADPVELVNAPSSCKYDLEEPSPTEDIADFAASLGRDESGGSGLGEHFAEWVTIRCT